MKTLGLLKEKHLNYLLATMARKHSSEFTVASLFSSIVSSGSSVMSDLLSGDLIPYTRNTHLLGEGVAPADLAEAEHKHSEYLRLDQVSAGIGLVAPVPEPEEPEEPEEPGEPVEEEEPEYILIGPAGLALQRHEHPYVKRTEASQRSYMLGNVVPGGFSPKLHVHDDKYHLKVVDNAYKIGGRSYREFSPAEHDHGYYYHRYQHDDPVKEAELFWDPRLEIPILPEDLAPRVHKHPDRYFEKPQADDIFLEKNSPYPNGALIKLRKLNYNIASAVSSVSAGSTNFTKLCLPGLNKDITSNVFSAVQTASAVDSYYVMPVYVDVFVYPGSYVSMTLPYPVRAVLPASYAFELDKKAGAQEYVYPFWKGNTFGVYLYDYPDIEESPYVRLLVFLEVPFDKINLKPEVTPGDWGIPGIDYPSTYLNRRAQLYGMVLPPSEYDLGLTMNLDFRVCWLSPDGEFYKTFAASCTPGNEWPSEITQSGEVVVRKYADVFGSQYCAIRVNKFSDAYKTQFASVRLGKFYKATQMLSCEINTKKLVRIAGFHDQVCSIYLKKIVTYDRTLDQNCEVNVYLPTTSANSINQSGQVYLGVLGDDTLAQSCQVNLQVPAGPVVLDEGAQLNANVYVDINRTYEMSISGAAAELTDYQVMVEVPGSISVPSFTNLDFYQGTTRLNYWWEGDRVLWVKVPTIPTSGTTITMYVDQAGLYSGDNTFLFFDDFSSSLSSSKWVKNEEVYTVTNNKLYASVPSASSGVLTTHNKYSNCVFHIKAKLSADNSASSRVLFPTSRNYSSSAEEVGSQRAISGYGGSFGLQIANDSLMSGVTLTTGDWLYFTYKLPTSGNAVAHGHKVGQSANQSNKTAEPTNREVYLGIRQWIAGTGVYDYVFIRKYSATEPVASFG